VFQKGVVLIKNSDQYSNLVMAIQILNSISPFVTKLLKGHFRQHLTNMWRNSDMSFAFANLLEKMNSGKTQYIDICDFKRIIDFHVITVKDETVDTLIALILNRISLEYDSTSNIIDLDFEIKFITQRKCNECDFSLTERESSYILNIEMPNSEIIEKLSLTQCLEKQLCLCPNCQSKNCKKIITMENLPKVLIINVNRNNDDRLIISKLNDFQIKTTSSNIEENFYNLVAVGSRNINRFTGYCKNVYEGLWCNYNDNVKFFDVEANSASDLMFQNATLFVYVKKINEIPELVSNDLL
jgi:hypothetical protein